VYKLDKKILEKMKMGKKVKIVAYGDSITKGLYLRRFGVKKGFVEIWQKRLRQHFSNPNIKVMNKGYGGILMRTAYFNLWHVIEEGPDLVTLMFGHNDRESQSPPGVFKKYMRKTIINLQKFTKSQILLLSPSILLDKDYDKKTAPYLEVLKVLSQEFRLELVDVAGYFEQKFTHGLDRRSCFFTKEEFRTAGFPGYQYLDDEALHHQVIVHPNQKGHELITEVLMEFEEKT
jgi:lysophospholipase L1-like esterase